MGWVVLLAVVGVAMMAVVRRDAVRRYSISATAIAKGIDNTPTDPTIIQRLEYLATQEPYILAVLREVEPLAHMTSAYRCPELNAAVGGVATSRHPLGLALDFGGISDNVAAVAHAHAQSSRLPGMRLVLAEHDHVHCEWFDPLRIADKGTTETKFLRMTYSDPPYAEV